MSSYAYKLGYESVKSAKIDRDHASNMAQGLGVGLGGGGGYLLGSELGHAISDAGYKRIAGNLVGDLLLEPEQFAKVLKKNNLLMALLRRVPAVGGLGLGALGAYGGYRAFAPKQNDVQS